jgi:hypothetical protein
MTISWATVKTIGERVVGAFAVAFLAALPATLAGWHVSVLEKAGYAGLAAALALVQSLLWTLFSGQPQLTPAARVGAAR